MLLIGMVRTKVLALLLGPSGVGLVGVYDSMMNLAKTISGLGVNSSGVKQIASAVGSGNEQTISMTVMTLRRVCLILGVAGALAIFLLRTPLSRLTFDNDDHATDIGILAIILLFSAVNGGQGALLQGTRRIGDLAKMGIIGAILGAALTIPIIFVWGQQGIPAYMVLNAGIVVTISWWFTRRIPIKKITVTSAQIRSEVVNLLKLGFVFLSTAIASLGSQYLMRVLVTRQEGTEGAGQFQAANGLSLVYVGFILQAMGTDFYPRLTGVAEDNAKCNQLVNEQAEISVLLALPGILGTLAFAPWVIPLFYSSKFGLAIEILCWQMPGMFLLILSWPMAFILVAKGNAKTYFWTEVIATAVYLSLAYLGLRYFQLPGTGMAFTAFYAFYWFLIYGVVRKASGFKWSVENNRLSLAGIITTCGILVAHFYLPQIWVAALGAVVTLSVGLFCLKRLVGLVGAERINDYLRKARIRIPFPPNWGR